MVFNTQALVLKSSNYKEADKSYILFTKNIGKIRAVGKGVRKLKSKKAGGLDSFTHVNLGIVEKSGFYVVTQVESINSFSTLKNSLKYSSWLFFIGETLDNLLPNEQESEILFKYLTDSLNKLNCAPSKEFYLYIVTGLLKQLGYWSSDLYKTSSVNVQQFFEKGEKNKDSANQAEKFISDYIQDLVYKKFNSYNFMENVQKVY